MAFTAWNLLCSGRLRTDSEEEERERTQQNGRQGFNPSWKRNETERKAAAVLEKIGNELGTKNIRAGALI